ncbi:hypothetical protein OM076_06205 [Solirubrobacter ginsenosidimutans]|uniref:MBG domain-containing protein n=1 Tax=Solirubrobacter ginsenosidimutans TaxID=490573 RepID=A0A9X3MQ69_9ACTN|nr:hypothetical protein [Solirubrobacter ginsenosidimutans]MDA0159847.1 hypothetical protein [Solirubrobacter ginsenosidimutans]
MRTLALLGSRAAALVVCVLAALTIGPSVATAAADCPSGLGGHGTAASPCLIGSAAELYGAMSAINADTARNGAATEDYRLTADIDATTYSTGTAGPATASGPTENWSGIDWFSGTFDGDGYAISNLNYTSDSLVATLPSSGATAGLHLGFFRVLNGATVENLTLRNVRANNPAVSNLSIGGVAVWSFASTISGTTLADPTILDAPGGGSSYVGGLVALAYANRYANSAATVSDGGSTSFRDNLVSGGSIADANRTGGIVGMATGPTTVADNSVNTTLSNPTHPVDGTGGQVNTYYYVIGGLVGEVGTTYTTSEGSQAAGVSMSDNVIGGIIKGSATGHRSNNGVNFASATVGYATVAGHVATSTSPTASNWATENNLVSSDLQYTNETGPGLPNADGTSVSPATLKTESTYSASGTGLTDPATAATYDELHWDFAGTSGWAWTGTSTDGAPVPAVAPRITLDNGVLAFLSGPAPPSPTLLAGAKTNHGTLSIDTGGVAWSTPGTYTATVTAANGGFSTSKPLTIVIVSNTVPLARTTGGLETSSTAPSTAEVLAALGAVLPQEDGGTLGVEYPNGEPDWDTPGSYTVKVTDTGGADGLQPATATIRVVAPPTVTVAHSTVSFRSGTTVTAQDVLDAVTPTATYSAGDSGTLTADISSVGSAVGAYTATIIATDRYGFSSAPVTVTVAISAGNILLADATPVFQVTNTAPSEQAILSALGAVMPAGTTGTATVSGYAASDFQTPGEYLVTVSDTNTSEGVPPVTATIEVVPVSVVSVPNATVYFNTAKPPTAADVLSRTDAKLTDGSGNTVAGSLSADVSQVHGASAGTYSATLSGVDLYGFTTAAVTVTVDVSAAVVSVAHDIATFTDTGSAPSQAALVSALGASVSGSTGGGQPVVDTAGVDWSVPGSYAVHVSDDDANDAADAVTASIRVVPVPVVTLPLTTVYLPVNANHPLPAATLLANSGASLTDGHGNAVAGTLSADTSGVNGTVAGTYTATVTGVDEYGFHSAPVKVTVLLYLSSQPTGTVSIAGTASVGGTLTAELAGWAGLVTPTYQWLRNGLPIPGATAATYTVAPGDAGQRLAVEVSEAPDWYAPVSAMAPEVTVAALAGDPGPSGSPAPVNPAPPATTRPAAPKVSSSSYSGGAVRLKLRVSEKGSVTVKLTMKAGKKTITLGTRTVTALKAGTLSTSVTLSKSALAKIKHAALTVTETITFKPATGKSVSAHRTLTIRRGAR